MILLCRKTVTATNYLEVQRIHNGDEKTLLMAYNITGRILTLGQLRVQDTQRYVNMQIGRRKDILA